MQLPNSMPISKCMWRYAYT